jgi:RHS repeat-associated protein
LTIASIAYAGPGRVARRSHGNGTRMDLAYDSVRRMIRNSHSKTAAFQDREYAWDNNYNKTLDHDLLSGGISQAFSFDSAYRLKQVALTGSIVENRGYELDSAGNRVKVTGDGDAGNYVLAPSPENDAALNQYTQTPFDQRGYDANGNLTRVTAGAAVSNLQFDYMNRLVQFETGGQTTRYSYDAFGRRVKIASSAGTTLYSYLGGQLVEEQDGSGATEATYVFAGGLNDVVSMQRGGVNYWLHADHLRSVRTVTDSAGAVVERYEYDEFGNVAFFSGAGALLTGSAVGNPFLYTGHQYDATTGFYYARNRYYDPRTGRFITRDPAGAWSDSTSAGNAFAYAGNNPSSMVDLMGLSGSGPSTTDMASSGLSLAGTVTEKMGGSQTAAAGLVEHGEKLLEKAMAARIEGNRLGNSLMREMEEWVQAFQKGNVFEEGARVNATYQDLQGIMRETTVPGPLINQGALGRAAAEEAVNGMYRRGRIGGHVVMETKGGIFADGLSSVRQSHYYADTTENIAKLDQQAANWAQRGNRLVQEGQRASRLAKAGKVLSVVGVVVDTGSAAYRNYQNCADAVTAVNDVGGTLAANLLVNAAPPVALVDAVSGGAVTATVHNAITAPVYIARVIGGNLNGRQMNAIRQNMSSNWFTGGLWSAGEGMADFFGIGD